MKHQDVHTNGVRLHVVTAGPEDGPPVLMLHGFPEYWGGWSRQIEPLVQAGYRLIIPDQRGYNTSDKPRRVSDYRMDTLALDMVGLLDHFGLERAHVVCHDWGGAIGWWLAQHHEERVDRFCVLNMPHVGVMSRHLLGPRQLKKSWYIFAFQLPRLPERLLLADDCDRLVSVMFANTTTKPFTSDEIAGYKQAWQQPGALRAMVNWYRAAARNLGLRPRNSRVHRPTLMIWGRQD